MWLLCKWDQGLQPPCEWLRDVVPWVPGVTKIRSQRREVMGDKCSTVCCRHGAPGTWQRLGLCFRKVCKWRLSQMLVSPAEKHHDEKSRQEWEVKRKVCRYFWRLSVCEMLSAAPSVRWKSKDLLKRGRGVPGFSPFPHPHVTAIAFHLLP